MKIIVIIDNINIYMKFAYVCTNEFFFIFFSSRYILLDNESN